MIQFSQVGKRYPSGHEALSAISFHIDPGEIVFLTGHSGAGKSTLLKLMALIERPSFGQIMINNRNLARMSRRSIPYHRRDIGKVVGELLGSRLERLHPQ